MNVNKGQLMSLSSMLFFFLLSSAIAQSSFIVQEREVLRQKISNSKCAQSVEKYRACMAAADAISFRAKGIHIVPKDFSWESLKNVYEVQTVLEKTEDNLDFVRLKVVTSTSEVTENLRRLTNKHNEELQNAWAHDYLVRKVSLNVEGLIDQLMATHDRSGIQTLSLTALSAFSVEDLKDGHASFTSASIEHSTSGVSQKEVVGIGIQYVVEAPGLRIKEALNGSPASQAQLQANDLIVKVDGQDSFEARGAFRLAELLFGEEGSTVEIEYYRGSVLSKKKIKRVKYNVKLAEYIELNYHNEAYGVIKLRTFSYKGACDDVKESLMDAKARGVTSFILDLRDNGGGMEDQARCIAGLFLKEHEPLYKYYNFRDKSQSDVTPSNPDPVFMAGGEEDSHHFRFNTSPFPQTQSSYQSAPPSRFPVKDKLVVLINSGSASASEMLAGGLRDHLRAIIVGETSFGKGCGQKSDQIPGTGVFQMSTKYYFLRPSGVSVQQIGITPDIQTSTSSGIREKDLVLYSLPAYSNGVVPVNPLIPGVKACLESLTDNIFSDVGFDQSVKTLSCIE